jgi:hypothetical protein
VSLQFLQYFSGVIDEQVERIEKVPKREFIRLHVNQHTLEKICKQQPVRANKLAKCLKVLAEYNPPSGKERHFP